MNLCDFDVYYYLKNTKFYNKRNHLNDLINFKDLFDGQNQINAFESNVIERNHPIPKIINNQIGIGDIYVNILTFV